MVRSVLDVRVSIGCTVQYLLYAWKTISVVEFLFSKYTETFSTMITQSSSMNEPLMSLITNALIVRLGGNG